MQAFYVQLYLLKYVIDSFFHVCHVQCHNSSNSRKQQEVSDNVKVATFSYLHFNFFQNKCRQNCFHELG